MSQGGIQVTGAVTWGDGRPALPGSWWSWDTSDSLHEPTRRSMHAASVRDGLAPRGLCFPMLKSCGHQEPARNRPKNTSPLRSFLLAAVRPKRCLGGIIPIRAGANPGHRQEDAADVLLLGFGRCWVFYSPNHPYSAVRSDGGGQAAAGCPSGPLCTQMHRDTHCASQTFRR